MAVTTMFTAVKALLHCLWLLWIFHGYVCSIKAVLAMLSLYQHCLCLHCNFVMTVFMAVKTMVVAEFTVVLWLF